jgi:hypothetical protein
MLGEIMEIANSLPGWFATSSKNGEPQWLPISKT